MFVHIKIQVSRILGLTYVFNNYILFTYKVARAVLYAELSVGMTSCSRFLATKYLSVRYCE